LAGALYPILVTPEPQTFKNLRRTVEQTRREVKKLQQQRDEAISVAEGASSSLQQLTNDLRANTDDYNSAKKRLRAALAEIDRLKQKGVAKGLSSSRRAALKKLFSEKIVTLYYYNDAPFENVSPVKKQLSELGAKVDVQQISEGRLRGKTVYYKSKKELEAAVALQQLLSSLDFYRHRKIYWNNPDQHLAILID
jgi:chromosome segregation ATPase